MPNDFSLKAFQKCPYLTKGMSRNIMVVKNAYCWICPRCFSAGVVAVFSKFLCTKQVLLFFCCPGRKPAINFEHPNKQTKKPVALAFTLDQTTFALSGSFHLLKVIALRVIVFRSVQAKPFFISYYNPSMICLSRDLDPLVWNFHWKLCSWGWRCGIVVQQVKPPPVIQGSFMGKPVPEQSGPLRMQLLVVALG